MNKLEYLQEVTEHILVAHHVPGRIRLKLKSLPSSVNLSGFKHSKQYIQFIESLSGVKSVRPNLLARSCVVEYDKTVLTPSLWESLLQAKAEPEVLALLDNVELHFQSFKENNA